MDNFNRVKKILGYHFHKNYLEDIRNLMRTPVYQQEFTRSTPSDGAIHQSKKQHADRHIDALPYTTILN